MRLIAVTRVLNEDDIVEAFLRHYAPLVDHHILLDNGSNDRTIDILRSLKSEGLRLTVLQNRSPMYADKLFNTRLFQLAVREFAADWVLCLDCDEFLDERQVSGGLRVRLDTLPADEVCLNLPWTRYHPTPQDDAAEQIVPRRIRFRESKLVEIFKVCVRSSAAAHGVEIDAGNHLVLWQGHAISAVDGRDLPLAHYYRRSPWQQITKAVIGRLKVLAAGQAEAVRAVHYTALFEAIRNDPEAVLGDVEAMEQLPRDIIADPIAYQGGELRYTLWTSPMMKAAQMITAYAESLAEQHGRLVDGNVAVRMVTENMAGHWTQIM